MTAHTTMRSSTRTPAIARAFARDALRRAPAPGSMDDVTLVVSELVTNAVVHGAGDVSLDVVVEDDAIRVEVADAEPVLQVPPPASLDGESGRGLMLVSRLAQRWGVRHDDRGKVVWADLPTRR